MVSVYLGIGSNIDREKNIRAAVSGLTEKFGELLLSSVYESRAYGFEGNNFYNLVAGFDTDLEIRELMDFLRGMEISCGREKQSKQFTPRSIDLDLLLYGDLVQHDNEIDIPRDDINRYAFVLCPLAQIAPLKKHPESGETFLSLWQSFEDKEQKLWPVEFSFEKTHLTRESL